MLVVIPVLIVFYVWILHHRRRVALHYSSLFLVREAIPQSSWLRRHLPFGLFLLALASLTAGSRAPGIHRDCANRTNHHHPSHRCLQKYVLHGYSTKSYSSG